MHGHDNSLDDHDDDRLAVVIPLPRKVPDDDIESLPEIGSDQPVWW
jgi:hypothetical protein